jgi:hypothetical protein
VKGRRAKPDAPAASPWRSRIVGHGKAKPDTLVANPANWRLHSKRQREALAEVLDRVGWVQEVIVNRRTGNLVDGHLRVELAVAKGDRTIPVSFVDLAEDEEALILATLDPLAGLATVDADKLTALVSRVGDLDGALRDMVQELAVVVRDGQFNPQDLVDSFAEGVGQGLDEAAFTLVIQREDLPTVRGAIKVKGMRAYAASVVEIARAITATAGDGGHHAQGKGGDLQ